jgi:hypothetical protein
MDLTLDQLLTIIGRLDDSPGFDTPRERFRRFLVQRMDTLESARQMIQQCREHAGEQSHRALQDAVVLAGRFLGFETSFGRYQSEPGVDPVHGRWLSRHRLQVTTIVCTDQTPDVDPQSVSRGVSDEGDGSPRIVLLVITPFYAGRDRLERALAAAKPANLRLITLRGLLRAAGMLGEGHLTHEDILHVFNPGVSLDGHLDLLERVAAVGRGEPAIDTFADPIPGPERQERRYWVNVMRSEVFTSERVVHSLLGTRQILGINPAPGLEDRVRAGDAICVFMAGRGIVAHAHIAGILTDGSRVIRDAKQFTHVLRLANVVVYDTPVAPNPELARKLELALTEEAEAVTAPISPREFESITAATLSQAS